MLTLTLWSHNACMSCDSHMTHLLTPSPLTSQCSAACQWTGRYSVLPPSSPSQGAWPLNLCVCSINWDTSRKSSTGGGIACMLLSLSQLHTCSVVYTQTCVHTRMHACTHTCTNTHTAHTTVYDAPEAEVVNGTNSVHHKHQVVHAGLLPCSTGQHNRTQIGTKMYQK